MKTTLDGGLSQRCANVFGLRLQQTAPDANIFDENAGTTGMREIHQKEAVEEKMSLSDRFGVRAQFLSVRSKRLSAAVQIGWKISACRMMGNRTDGVQWKRRRRGNRSGRSAWQFAPATGRAGCPVTGVVSVSGVIWGRKESHICCCCGVRYGKMGCWIPIRHRKIHMPDKWRLDAIARLVRLKHPRNDFDDG